jgi:hypothetical protein
MSWEQQLGILGVLVVVVPLGITVVAAPRARTPALGLEASPLRRKFRIVQLAALCALFAAGAWWGWVVLRAHQAQPVVGGFDPTEVPGETGAQRFALLAGVTLALAYGAELWTALLLATPKRVY